jgi:hypothetical protein
MSLWTIERGAWNSEAQSRIVSMPSLVLGSVLAFFIKRSLQQLSLRAAPRHRSIASLWRARLSITLAREKSALAS